FFLFTHIIYYYTYSGIKGAEKLHTLRVTGVLPIVYLRNCHKKEILNKPVRPIAIRYYRLQPQQTC
ncbi:MAG: hypothetical protein LUH10_00005, partial [Tannerellaceae bacterium]|nr:hypothetical protein [Tannerellaceae bacterium]